MFFPENFKGKKALVIGAGRSGVWCANLLASRGFRVLLTENRPRAQVRDRLKELRRGVEVEAGGHTNGVFSCGFAVKSPGLSHSNPLIVKLRRRGIPVFSEIETALAFSRSGELLAVTGTNGKTTTTMLLGEIMKRHLKAKRASARVCGNIGMPAAKVIAAARPGDAIVMEVSSYQLEDSSHIRPAASCILNITPDHIDHHKTMAAYIAAKARAFRFQRGTDFCVFNRDDGRCRLLARSAPSRALFFSSTKKGGGLNAWVEGGRIVFSFGGKKCRVTPPDLPGRHNLENAMCAGLMALSRGVSPEAIEKAFRAFKGVEHRIEPVRMLKGVSFVNDSKATNVDSTLVALKALGGRRNIWLILGGLDKGSPYAPLLPYIRSSVRRVLTIGSAAPRIEKELAGCPLTACGDMAAAVSEAFRNGEKGDIALLSPACASFDQFKDYEDRGRKFKALVRKLKA